MRAKKVKKRLVAWVVLAMLLSQNILSVAAETDQTATAETNQVTQAAQETTQATKAPEETEKGTKRAEETKVAKEAQAAEGTAQKTQKPEVTEAVTPAAKEINQVAPLAAPLTGGLLTDYLTDFEFTDVDEVTFSDSNKVTTTSAVNITYSFNFANDLDIQKDAEFTLDLPNVFELQASLSTPMVVNNDAGINVKWWIDANAKVHLKFYEAVPTSNVRGKIWISTKVDESKISGENVEFDLGSYDGSKTYPIEYPDEGPEKVSVKKEAVKNGFDPKKQTIQWCITVTPENILSLAGLTVHDVFEDPEIMELSDVYLDKMTNKITSNVVPTLNGFEYTFANDIAPGVSHKLYVVTHINPDVYEDEFDSVDDSHRNTIYFENTAEVKRGNTLLEKATSTATFGLNMDTIDKVCTKQDWVNNEFVYTVTINQEYLRRENVKIVDRFPKGFEVNDGWTVIEEDVGDITSQMKNIVYNPIDNTFSFELAEINHPVTITLKMSIEKFTDDFPHDTDLEPIKENGKIIGYRALNIAEVHYDGKKYGQDQVEIEKGIDELDNALEVVKTGEVTGYADGTQAISKWTSVLSNVDVNKSVPIIFKDTIESPGQTYLPGSFMVNDKPVDDSRVWDGNQQLTYTLSQEDCQQPQCIITYKTYLHLSENSEKFGETFENTATVEYGEYSTSDDASVTTKRVDMVSKNGKYNPKTQEFEWSVFANRNAEFVIKNLMIEDILPENHEYIEDSAKAYNVKAAGYDTIAIISERANLAVTKDSDGNPTFAMGDCEGFVQLVFRTKMKEGFDPATAYNEVSMRADNVGGLEASTTVEVSFDPSVEKRTYYIDGASVEWEVDINTTPMYEQDRNTLIQVGTYLEDVLHPSLEVDLSSVNLYEIARDNASDDYDPVKPVTAISGGDASFEKSNRTFTYKLPEDIDLSKSYRLVFTTNVINGAARDLNNSITLKSSSYDKTATSDTITLSNLGGLAILEGDNLQISLKKTGEGNQPLKDVGFEMYEVTSGGAENVIEDHVTPANGIIRFTKGIKFKHTYYLRETNIPDGYKDATDDIYIIEIGDGNTKTSETVKIKITKNAGEADPAAIFNDDIAIDGGQFVIPLKIENKVAEVDAVKIRKTDITGSNEVNGATLTIYEKKADGDKGAAIDTWVSGENGEVEHEVDKTLLGFGKSYILEETQAPDGYEIAEAIEFSIDADGDLIVAAKDLDEDGNIIMRDELTPTITTVDLLLSKKVTGTAGDKTKEFTFKITLKDLNDVELTDSFTYLKNQANGGTLTSGGTVTLKDGDVVEIKDLPVGTSYTIVESDNAGYVVTKTGDTGVTVAGTNSTATFQNHKDEEPKEPITIRKTDIAGSEEVDGATLTIYHKNSDGSKGDVIETWVSGEAGETVHEIAHNKFAAGESYILEETSAPNGYAYAEDIEFSIESDGTVTVAAKDLDADGNIIMKDEVTKVNFKKTDVAGEEVEGATLTIYEKNADGTKGKEITHWISGKDAHTVEKQLNVGQEYILEETSAPDGYEYASDITFSVKEDGSVEATAGVVDKDGNVVMVDKLTPTITTVDLFLKKTVTGTAGDKTKDFTFIVTLKDLNGQELSDSFAYLKNQANGGTLKSGDSIKLKHDDVVVIKGLPAGTSYEVEESDNADYVVTPQGDKGITVAGTDVQVTFINHKDDNVVDGKDIVIRKTDITGSEEVAGAALTVYRKNSDGSKGDVIAAWTSGDEAYEIPHDKFTPGESYILEETGAPDGYAYAADIEFSIENDGTVQVAAKDLDADGNIVMKDAATIATFKKTDVGGQEVAGATLTIYEKNSDGSRGKEITQWVSGQDGEKVHVVEGMLNAGQTYILHETSAPEGYAYADDIEFTLTANGTLQIVSEDADEDGNIVMKDEPEGSVQISKVASNGYPLEGAILSIYTTDAQGKKTDTIAKDNNGKELTWTTTNHPVNITNLKYGTYVLHEEKAPEGYLVAADIYFTIKEDEGILKRSRTGMLEGKTIVMEDIRDGDVKPGSVGLTINKTVTGREGDKDKPFTFTVSFTDENGEELEDVFIYTYGDIEGGERGTFRSGESVYLAHGEVVQIFGMPEGTNYEVIESDNEGYEVIEDNTSGTIGDAGDGQEASFINHMGEEETPTPTPEEPTETPTVTPTPSTTPTGTPKVTPAVRGNNNTITKAVKARTYKSVKTGDTTQLMLWVLGMLGAAGVISTVMYKKKRKEQCR